ncbi:MAG: recombinase family protein [Candidatus Omnitrophota bacterium]|nr:recombinase family protein [Candidatus Omnitrophota bacterium]
MKKVAIYARVSSERQEQEKTIESQLQELRNACKDHQIVDEYIDDGWSGETLARPQLDRLRDDAPRGLFEAVYILCPDRLSRDLLGGLIVKQELEKKGVKVVFNNKDYKEDLEGDFYYKLDQLIADKDKRTILDRFRRGKMHKAEMGLVVGTSQPYGYDYVKKTPEVKGYYIINEEEAVVVREIFRMYLEVQSILKVAKQMTEKGIYLPRKKGKLWRPSTINEILKNETYIGLTYFNKHKSVEPKRRRKNNGKYNKRLKTSSVLRDKGEWIGIKVPAIIDEKTFSLVRDLLAKNHYPFGRAKHEYLLSNLLQCSCGGRYGGNHNAGYVYYRCSSRKGNNIFSARECNSKLVRSAVLDEAVWSAVYGAVIHPKTLLGFLEFISEKTGNTDAVGKEISELEKRAEKEEFKKNKLIELYQGEIISKEECANKMDEANKLVMGIKNEISQKKERISQAQDVPVTKELVVQFCKMAQDKLKNLNFEQKRMFLRTVLDKVIYNDSQKSAKIIGEIPLYDESFSWTEFKEYLYRKRAGKRGRFIICLLDLFVVL